MHRKHNPIKFVPWILLLMMIGSCNDGALQVSREAAQRQAQQNTAMAELNKEVAGGTRDLVAADAQARKEIVGIHHDLQTERSRLDAGWSALEGERQQIARQRRTESLFAPAVQAVGLLLVVALLLGFSWYALVVVRNRDTSDAELSELIIDEIVPEQPALLSSCHPSLLNPPTEHEDG